MPPIASLSALIRPPAQTCPPFSRRRAILLRNPDVGKPAGAARQAAIHLQAARSGFEELLAKHPLAFADHGAEFYAGSGADPVRAFELAQKNLANRPTLRAFEQAYATALAAGEAF